MINFINKKMEQETSTTWSKLYEIPTTAKTEKELVEAVKGYTDTYSNDEEIIDVLNSEWATICIDGIIIWMDGE
jgi:hypothetical protein